MNIKRVVMYGAIISTALVLAACGQVHPGHVGIKVNQYGSDAGVSATALGVGTYMTPPGTSIIEYPVFTQQYTYTASSTEGNTTNEEFSFNDRNGVPLTADIGVSYSVSDAPKLYTKFRSTAEGLVANQIRNEIRNELNEVSSGYVVDDIQGPKKVEFLNEVSRRVAAHFAPFGLNIESLFWSGLHLPDAIQAQINNRQANEQQANVATATANAQAKVAEAKGQADANALLAQSISNSPQIIQLKAIEKWDGTLPTYVGAGTPLPFINAGK